MLRSLALASLLLAPTVAVAQKTPFPDGGGHLGGTALAVTWQGKPAILLMGTGGNLPGHAVVFYDPQNPQTVRQTPVFTLRAVLAYDGRQCAIDGGNWVWLSPASDDPSWMRLPGTFGADGCLTWQGAFPVSYNRHHVTMPPPFAWAPRTYIASQCAWGWGWVTQCDSMCQGPQFVAMVLTIEGMGW